MWYYNKCEENETILSLNRSGEKMTKFEVGERYRIGGIAVEIVGRSARYVTYRNIQHVGKFNEKEEKKKGKNKRAFRKRMVSCGTL